MRVSRENFLGTVLMFICELRVVFYDDEVSVKAAIEALNGSELAGRKIIVREV